MKTLKIVISTPDRFKTGESKELNRFSIDYDDSVIIDFSMLLRAFDVLYPINKLVEFKIFNYGTKNDRG